VPAKRTKDGMIIPDEGLSMDRKISENRRKPDEESIRKNPSSATEKHVIKRRVSDVDEEDVNMAASSMLENTNSKKRSPIERNDS
jgi:hypothetical protein